MWVLGRRQLCWSGAGRPRWITCRQQSRVVSTAAESSGRGQKPHHHVTGCRGGKLVQKLRSRMVRSAPCCRSLQGPSASSRERSRVDQLRQVTCRSVLLVISHPPAWHARVHELNSAMLAASASTAAVILVQFSLHEPKQLLSGVQPGSRAGPRGAAVRGKGGVACGAARPLSTEPVAQRSLLRCMCTPVPMAPPPAPTPAPTPAPAGPTPVAAPTVAPAPPTETPAEALEAAQELLLGCGSMRA